ncbi:helix-turn-helix domain-containing protein [Pseudomonas sp. NPDC089401]|uniref:helix-turn-helix domain-containing protein n=1 Tax=Pseudomonas sp. NPDC089401 TaxID=3364462 RepID=UPI0038123355
MKQNRLDGDTIELLSQSELNELDARIAANADKWLKDHAPKTKSKATRKSKSNRGRKPKVIENPFFGFIDCTSHWGRYPVFAESIIEGVARLDWHDRPIGKGGKSMPLSVRNIAVILESLPVISNEAVEDLLQLGERHARRYFKAMQLIIRAMMENRPQALINEMEGIEPAPKACEWEDSDNACTPSPEVLTKLHYDLRTLTEFNSAEEYEADYPPQPGTVAIVAFPNCHAHQQRQHLKKPQALEMLAQGQSVKSIERGTGVSAKTIRKWREELQAAQVELKAA